MLMVNQLVGFGGGQGLILPSAVHTALTENGTANQTSYSFPSQNFGAESPTRKIVAVLGWEDTGNARTISSITIGGVAASIHVNNSTNIGMGIFSAAVPTGLSGTVAITPSGQCDRMTCALFALYDAAASPTNTLTDNTVSSNACSGTLIVPADGIVIAGWHAGVLSGTQTNWVGITEAFDSPFPSSAGRIRSGGNTAGGLTANAAYPISATGTNTTSVAAMAAASWAPA